MFFFERGSTVLGTIVTNVHTCALGITVFASLQSLSVVMNIQFFFSFLFAIDCCLGDYILFLLKEILGRRAFELHV